MLASDRDYLTDMLHCAEAAQRLLGSVDAEALVRNEEKFLAVAHALQNIGEAANRLSPDARARLSDVPWRRIIGMRHHLVHGYRTILPDVVVKTIRESIPSLIASLRRALEDDTQ
jgi:uncharacterized protein with HEPN domain